MSLEVLPIIGDISYDLAFFKIHALSSGNKLSMLQCFMCRTRIDEPYEDDDIV